MASRILISVQDGVNPPAWFDSEKIQKYVQNVLERLGYDDEEISILFCNNDEIHRLNKEYRNIDSATDILSFENGTEYEDEEGKWYAAGDIAISFDTLPENSEYFEVAQNEELKRLLIHGCLHLNGYDHGEEHIESGVEPKDEMLKLQEEILKEFSEINLISD